MGEMFKRTGRLFARPSFICGFARILDLGATLSEYNTNKDEKEADTQAILSDWLSVADSLNSAFSRFENNPKVD